MGYSKTCMNIERKFMKSVFKDVFEQYLNDDFDQSQLCNAISMYRDDWANYFKYKVNIISDSKYIKIIENGSKQIDISNYISELNIKLNYLMKLADDGGELMAYILTPSINELSYRLSKRSDYANVQSNFMINSSNQKILNNYIVNIIDPFIMNTQNRLYDKQRVLKISEESIKTIKAYIEKFVEYSPIDIMLVLDEFIQYVKSLNQYFSNDFISNNINFERKLMNIKSLLMNNQEVFNEISSLNILYNERLNEHNKLHNDILLVSNLLNILNEVKDQINNGVTSDILLKLNNDLLNTYVPSNISGNDEYLNQLLTDIKMQIFDFSNTLANVLMSMGVKNIDILSVIQPVLDQYTVENILPLIDQINKKKHDNYSETEAIRNLINLYNNQAGLYNHSQKINQINEILKSNTLTSDERENIIFYLESLGKQYLVKNEYLGKLLPKEFIFNNDVESIVNKFLSYITSALSLLNSDRYTDSIIEFENAITIAQSFKKYNILDNNQLNDIDDLIKWLRSFENRSLHPYEKEEVVIFLRGLYDHYIPFSKMKSELELLIRDHKKNIDNLLPQLFNAINKLKTSDQVPNLDDSQKYIDKLNLKEEQISKIINTKQLVEKENMNLKSELDRRHKKYESDLIELNQKLESRNNEIKAYQTEAESNKLNFNAFKTKHAHCEEEIKKHLKRIEQLQQGASQSESEDKKLIQQLRTELSNLEQKSLTFKKERDEKKDELVKLTKTYQELLNKYNQESVQHKSLSDEYDNFKRQQGQNVRELEEKLKISENKLRITEEKLNEALRLKQQFENTTNIQIQDYNKKIKELSDKINSLNNQLKTANEGNIENTKLRDNIKELMAKLENILNDKDKITKEYYDFKKYSEGQINQLKTDKTLCQDSKKSLLDEQQILKDNIKSLSEQLNEQNNKKEILNKEYKKDKEYYEKNISVLKQRMKDVEDERERLYNGYSKLKANRSENDEHVVQLKEKIESLTNEIDGRNEVIKSEEDKMTQLISDNTTKINNLNDHIKILNEQLETQKRECNQKITGASNDKDELRKQLENVKSLLSQEQQKYNTANKEVQKLNNDIRNMTSRLMEIDQLKQEKNKLLEEIEELKRQLDKLQKAANDCFEKIKIIERDSSATIQQKQSEINKLQSQIQQYASQTGKVQSQLNTLTHEHSKLNQLLKDNEYNMNSEKDQLINKINLLTSKNSDYEMKLNESHSNIVVLNREIEKLNNQLSSTTGNKTELMKKIEELNVIISNLEYENDELIKEQKKLIELNKIKYDEDTTKLINDFEIRIRESDDEKQKLFQQVKILENKLSSSGSELDKIKNQLLMKQKDLDLIDGKIKKLKYDIDTKETKIQDLTSKLTFSEKELERLRQEKKGLKAGIEDDENKLKDTIYKLQNVMEKLKALEENNLMLQDLHEKDMAIQHDFDDKINDLNDDVNRYKLEIVNLRNSLDNKNTKCQDVESRLNALINTKDSDNNQLKIELDKLKIKIKDYEDKELAKKLEEARLRELEQHERDMKKKAELVRLERDAQSAKKERMESDCTNAKKQIKDDIENLSRLKERLEKELRFITDPKRIIRNTLVRTQKENQKDNINTIQDRFNSFLSVIKSSNIKNLECNDLFWKAKKDFDESLNDLKYRLGDISNLYENMIGIGRVYLRIKPPVQPVTTSGVRPSYNTNRPVINVKRDKVNMIDTTGIDQREDYGPFDKIYNEHHTTNDIYKDIESLITNINSGGGYNLLLMTYGQSESGKTFTLLGNKDNTGILGKVLNYIQALNQFKSTNGEEKLFLKIFQLYNAKGGGSEDGFILDMLSTTAQTFTKPKRMNQEEDKEAFVSTGLRDVSRVTSISFSSFLNKVDRNAHLLTDLHINKWIAERRFQRETYLNPDSSRSHCFIDISMKLSKDKNVSIVFIDLGGNENLLSHIKGSEGKTKPAVYYEGLFIINTLRQLSKNILPNYNIGKKVSKSGDISNTFYHTLDYYLDLSQENIFNRSKRSEVNKFVLFAHIHGYYKKYSSTKDKNTEDTLNKSIQETTENTLKFVDNLIHGGNKVEKNTLETEKSYISMIDIKPSDRIDERIIKQAANRRSDLDNINKGRSNISELDIIKNKRQNYDIISDLGSIKNKRQNYDTQRSVSRRRA